MLTPISRHFSWLLVLLFTVAGQAQDLQIKKSITVGGNVISSTDSAIKGARERTVTQTAGGSTVMIRQCDLKQTVHINDQSQTYFVATDPQDDAALKAAALVTGSPAAESGGTITESTAITDTGERKTINGYPARHLTMRVAIQPSKNACSQQSQEFEVDGWYADLSKEFASCQQSLPPVRQTEGCSDRVIHKVTGSGKPGYPLAQTITLHNGDGSTMQVGVQVSEISKQALAKELFDVPAGYREVKSLAELNASPAIPTPPPATYAANPQAAMMASQNGMKSVNPAAMMLNPSAQMAMTQNAALSQQMMAARMGPGAAFMGGGVQPQGSAMVAAPQQLGPKAPGRIRIGVAPPEAQLGQGTNAGVDYSTPIRNVEVALMNGPAIEIAALEAHVPLQLQAEAQQKQCDYILHSSINVKHTTGGSLGKFMKIGSTAASFTPVGMMAKGMGTVVAAQAAGAAASTAAPSACRAPPAR